MITESPYITHREILLNGRYGTAYLLQDVLLYQLNPWQYPFDIDQHRAGFDTRNLQIYKDMKWWYCYNGSDSEGFKDLAKTIETRKLKEAEELRSDLIRLRQMRPGDYPHEDGEDQLRAYQLDIRFHGMHYRGFVKKGYLEE
ncbi:hypothetical protein SRABI70_00881 [Pseudomonas sp. Bi70]|uniref:hypothetical protein n=1 Tax=Pseudomonas sp. Bi70 TaxID=2821127 RepID=UPI001DF47D0A|nr:hypothetical protein [Pseudomonas sp. Bi70]CAH0165733.1 hypothetical protein SRABI70_00881 [Pseudomonas sp. Bi70]